VLSSVLSLNVAVGIFARNPIAKREASSRSYFQLLHVRCRPFHPCFPVWTWSHDSSLFPSLTLRWVVVNHYVTLCSSDFPLYVHCVRASDNPSLHFRSFIFRIGISLKMVPAFSYALNSPVLQTGAFTRLA